MAAQFVVEIRMDGADKWEPDSGFGDFDMCHKRILTLLKKEGRIIRLVIPGSFVLSQHQRDTLETLGVQHNA